MSSLVFTGSTPLIINANFLYTGNYPFDPIAPRPLVSTELISDTSGNTTTYTLTCRIIAFIPIVSGTDILPITVTPSGSPVEDEPFVFTINYSPYTIVKQTSLYCVVYYDYRYSGLTYQPTAVQTMTTYGDPQTSRGTITTIQQATPGQ
jgi:hypothetical protein